MDERALVLRTSDEPLRFGNRLALLKNGPPLTYDDWLAAISRALCSPTTCHPKIRVTRGRVKDKPLLADRDRGLRRL
jgi:hypothetical protein